MWQAQVTQENVARLQKRGVEILGPGFGEQACGEFGPGRMLEPEQICQALIKIDEALLPQSLKGIKVVITAGPTREKCDPVRYLSNYSSGKMGFALAHAAGAAGAEVVLVTGPSQQTLYPHHPHHPHLKPIKRIDVESAQEMLAVVKSEIKNTHIFIANAAVADYRFANIAQEKIKKSADELQLTLVKNPDIVAEIAKLKHVFTVGFAAETENVIANAKQKAQRKQLDMIIANKVGGIGSDDEIGFESDDNAVTVIAQDAVLSLPKQNKPQLAKQLIELINQHYTNTKEVTDDTSQLKESTTENS